MYTWSSIYPQRFLVILHTLTSVLSKELDL